MARDLSEHDHKITFFDRLTTVKGQPTEIKLYYNMPTTAVRIAFRRKCITKDNDGNYLVDPFQARQDYGLPLITGFDSASFCRNGEGMSSNMDDDHYRADWREALKNFGGDIIDLFSRIVFEGGIAVTVEQDMYLQLLNQPPKLHGSSSAPEDDSHDGEDDGHHPLDENSPG